VRREDDGRRGKEEERKKRKEEEENDDEPTDLLCSRSDLVQQRIPHVAIDGEVVSVAVAAAIPPSTSISLFPRRRETGERKEKDAPEHLQRLESYLDGAVSGVEDGAGAVLEGKRGRGEEKKVSRGKGNRKGRRRTDTTRDLSVVTGCREGIESQQRLQDREGRRKGRRRLGRRGRNVDSPLATPYRYALAAEIFVYMSAILPCKSWKVPIGWPNCSRS
jgi:hypothetical protein